MGSSIFINSKAVSHIRGVCLDIDDTLSTDGKLTAEAYAALWHLKKAGFAVVPVTGRPAGWCDHIARFWPVHAVVGENGAFTFFMNDGVRRRLDTPGAIGRSTPAGARSFARLERAILKKFPRARWASDQSYREHDLAIDICEDVKPWSSGAVQKLIDLCESHGAHAKLSSIHLNTWFGAVDKRKGFNHWLSAGAPGLGKSVPKAGQWIFVGDSPNDEPMFAAFENSVGVANLKKYLPRLRHKPRWVTRARSGDGFVELARALLKA